MFKPGNKVSILVGVLSLILIPIWLIYIVPIFEKLPKDFTYEVELLSLDNLYDHTAKKFIGENISKSIFQYRVISTNKKYYEIDALFNVSTFSLKPIISIHKKYFINPYTGAHVPIKAVSEREGYLFAPRFLAKNDYEYWHINYSVPIKLHYLGQTKINGLTVYHYRQDLISDSTMYLTYLPGVPKEKGILTFAKIELWVEPVSGWLVKCQDHAISYYYDKKTNKIIEPWNKFSNRFTQNSIYIQSENAKFQKNKIILMVIIVPFLLLLMAIAFFSCYFLQNIYEIYHLNYKKISLRILKLLVVLVAFVLIILIYFLIKNYLNATQEKNKHVIVGVSVWQSNQETNEIIHNFKKGLEQFGYQEGKNIDFIYGTANGSIETQINLIDSYLNKEASLIFTMSTPSTLVAKGVTNKTPIVFTNVLYPESSGIIQSTWSSENNLVGSSSYISPARQFNNFEKFFPNIRTLGYFYKKGYPDSEIQLNEFKSVMSLRHIKVLEIPAIDQEDVRNYLKTQPKFDAIYVACDSLMQGGADNLIANYALTYKIPSFTCSRHSVREGILMSTIVDVKELTNMASEKAARILNGALPRWLHTDISEHYYVIINQSTANVLNNPSLMNELKNHQAKDNIYEY